MTDGLTIAAPSWKRAEDCITHLYLPDVRYVVCASQAEEYRANGLPVWECPDAAQGNVSRARNWILDNCETRWLLIVDDDLLRLGRWSAANRKKLDTAEAMDQIVAGFELAEEFGVRMWGVNVLMDKSCYSEHAPFGLSQFIGGPFCGFIDMDLRYDERLPLKEDYDLTLQVLNKYRKALRINFLHYEARQHTNVGGCSEYRTIEREKEQLRMLQAKWGSGIVKTGSSSTGRNTVQKKHQTYDINPVIKAPIGGM